MKRLAVVLFLAVMMAWPSTPQAAALGSDTTIPTLVTLAAAGDIDAAFELGERYTFGVRGAGVDYIEAARWYQLAADQGHRGAQTRMGEAYRYGDGVKQSFVEAMRWFRLAADEGFAPAQFQVALMYLGNAGVDRDLGEYRRWLMLGADQNHVRSMEALGDLLVDPNEGVVDYAEAMRLYTFAAQTGDGNAQFDLGVMYAEGEGVPVNNAEAYYWIALSLIAAPRDNRQALFAEVAAELSAKEIAALDQRVAAFVPVPPPTF